ncbi:MAG: hypothetical protein WA840_02980 [Caulobacteraceae bacterium]
MEVFGQMRVKATLEVKFHVDGVTQTVAFGRILPDKARHGDQDGERKTVPSYCAKAGDLHLANAVYGYGGELFGRAASGHWTSLDCSPSGDTLAIENNKAISFHQNGFVTAPYNWPRIFLKQIRLSQIAGLMSAQSCPLRLELSNGDIGWLDGGRGFYEESPRDHPPHQFIQKAVYEFDLHPEGFVFNYRFLINDLNVSQDGDHQAGWIADVVTIPWEVVVCRFPKLLRLHPSKTLATAGGAA